GGLAYLTQEHMDKLACNLDFVTLAAPSAEESYYLRCVLIKHCLMTGSPCGATLLNSGSHLPFVRVQPKQLPCTLEHTWAPILQRLLPLVPLAVDPLRALSAPALAVTLAQRRGTEASSSR